MMAKRFILDVYCEIDATDIGTELELFEGDVKDPDTGKLYKGTFVIKSLEELDKYEESIIDESQL
jgi:hypothetical protein